MNRLEDQVLKSDMVHAMNCLQGYEFYKDREPELAQYYQDTLNDLVDRKKRVKELATEEMIFDNAIWMLENGALNDEVSPLKVVNAIVQASVRLKLVRQTKAILTGNFGELHQAR